VEYSQKSASGSEAVNVFSISGNTTIPFCILDVSQMYRCVNLILMKPLILQGS
jgi:hypothetical protein